ncbi:DNA alkylation repair protein [Candidatus Undinarchaeota archaeon]
MTNNASEDILKKLRSLSSAKNVEGMARFGINPKYNLGVSMPNVRKIAKEIGTNHKLASELWNSGIHEARILASIIAEPKKFTEKQMDMWVKDFDSWDVCDQSCMNLFWKLPFADKKIFEYAKREEEFVRRTSFALMACVAWKDKQATNTRIETYFPLIKKYSFDDRNYVRKAVNWALRQIGKARPEWNGRAIAVAKDIQKIDSKTAKWVANDALRELQSDAVQKRLKK